jgi:hypothetical protein
MKDGYESDSVNLTEEDVNQVFIFVFEAIYSQLEDIGGRSAEGINVISSTQIFSRSS